MAEDIFRIIRTHGFAPLGWFAPTVADEVPDDARCVVLIGNAGPDMFRRFERERTPGQTLDDWTRHAAGTLAASLGARALFPFDLPPLPFQRWGRRANAGFTSPLGLNIHPEFGLWHAFRAALVFDAPQQLPAAAPMEHPCERCADQPCLRACPVSAFTGTTYEVQSCVRHIGSESGQLCVSGGCQARLACPVGHNAAYHPAQMRFHMQAFRDAFRDARSR